MITKIFLALSVLLIVLTFNTSAGMLQETGFPDKPLSSPIFDSMPLLPLLRVKRQRIGTQGLPQRFCTIFGCDCTPPPRAKCCKGYKYDKREKVCRNLA